MNDNFQINRKDDNTISILQLDGYLDANTIPIFEGHLQNLIEENRFHIVTDLERLNYISSAGLGVYMGFIEDVREEGGDSKLCNLSQKIFKVFDLLGFPALFDILETQEDCVKKFSG